MGVQEEKAKAGEFLMSEASRTRSRQKATLAANQSLRPGTLVAAILAGAAAAAATAAAGNTGNGAFGPITVSADAPLGVWRVVITGEGADAGQFLVERPDGVQDGAGKVGVAYDGGVGFTLADGATDFVVGDAFEIDVSQGDAESQVEAWAIGKRAVGLSWDWAETGAGETKEIVFIDGDAEVNGHLLDYPAGSTLSEKVEAREQLRRLGIKVR